MSRSLFHLRRDQIEAEQTRGQIHLAFETQFYYM